MIDYSFIRLKDSIELAKDMRDSPVTTHFSYIPIQLLPNKTYLQITNFDGGISLDSDCEVFVVDCNDNVLADITDNVFIEEFTDSSGNNQCKIEYVNLTVDFYRETVLIKFKMLSSNAQFWSNPINITSYQSERTVYFEYKNYDDFMGIGYTNANVSQSISLSMYFDIPIDDTETEDYFQISRNNTISARALQKLFEQYKIEQINRFTFERLNVLFKHELIYLDGVRVTNKPVVSSSERLGDANYFETDVVVAKNYDDTLIYSSQVFEGIQLTNFVPQGLHITGTTFVVVSFSANINLTLNTGTITIFNSTGTLQNTFTQADMTVSGSNLTIATSLSYSDDTYYVNISQGLVSAIGVLNSAITDQTTWAFELRASDYSVSDYSTVDYYTGASMPILDNLVAFYKFNETSGTVLVDSKGSNNGTVVNAVINQTGLIDRCYRFNDGVSNQYVTIPSSNDFNFGSGAFSIEVWVNRDSNNFGRILNKYNETTGDLEFRMFIQNGVLQFFMYTDPSNRMGLADNVTITTGSWQQVIITYDGSGVSGLKMKVDNVTGSFAPVETGNFTGMPNTNQQIVLAQQGNDLTGANRYSGLMDICRFWKGYALSDAEITTLYNSGNGTET
jgi:hypothetical protein